MHAAVRSRRTNRLRAVKFAICIVVAAGGYALSLSFDGLFDFLGADRHPIYIALRVAGHLSTLVLVVAAFGLVLTAQVRPDDSSSIE